MGRHVQKRRRDSGIICLPAAICVIKPSQNQSFTAHFPAPPRLRANIRPNRGDIMPSAAVQRAMLLAGKQDWTKDGFLARALHSLDMALQPIVKMRTGSVYGYEALMRGHAHLGLKSIAEVLNTAHRIGVADKLHLMLLDKALRKMRELESRGSPKLFFNLDGRALASDLALHEETGRLLHAHGVDPSTLCLEFSESYDYASAVEVAEMVAEHRALGIRFAIDDFGRGFSELKVLYEYHPEFIKIDRFFVTGMVADCRKRLFVSTVVNLAHVLGIRVVIEGIESEREYEESWRLGGDLAQGYFVAPPRLDFSDGQTECPHVRLALKRERMRRAGDRAVVHGRVERLATLPDGASMSEVFEAFRLSKDQSVIPIVDRAGEPAGIIHESDLKEYTYSPFGRDLLKNTSYRRTATDFVRKCPIADANASADAILDMFAYHPSTDGIILTQNGRYAGFLSALALLEILNDRRLETARDQNPLSKLPGNASITRYSETLLSDSERARFLCYIDFDNFKPFNDNYSFREGDRAIIMFADLMRRLFADSRYVIGHVGGDDFFLGATDVEEEELLQSLRTIRQRFAQSAESLYSASDRERGFIETRDRYGKQRRFPLLTCSIAVLEVAAGTPVESIDAVLHEITRIKRKAKKARSGIAFARYRCARPHKAGGTS